MYGYEVIYHGQGVEIPYPRPADGPNRRRPQGRSFHHGRFIQKLREAAIRTPNVTVIETTVTDLVKNGWTGQILGVQSQTRSKPDYVGYCDAQDTIILLTMVAFIVFWLPHGYCGWLFFEIQKTIYQTPASLSLKVLGPGAHRRGTTTTSTRPRRPRRQRPCPPLPDRQPRNPRPSRRTGKPPLRIPQERRR